MGRDSGELYRHQISAVNPDASILRGPFNDPAREQVGLPASWYTTGEWPADAHSRLLQEKYLTGPSYVAGAGEVLSGAELQRVRERLAQFCEVEECMST